MSTKFAVRVLCPEISKVVQEIAIENGYSWSGSKKADYLNKDVIYFDSPYMSHSELSYLSRSGIKEISLEEFINMFVEKPVIIDNQKVTFSKESIKVGCKTVDYATVCEIYERMKKLQ